MARYDNSDWYLKSQQLRIGGRLRMRHTGCSVGDTLLVTKSREGVSAWCFLCKREGMFVPAAALSLSEKVAQLASSKATETSMQRSVTLPLPKTEDVTAWPLEARVWLYKAGLSNDDIERCEIYYHTPSSRVVVPVRDMGSAVVFWQARSATSVPKYLNPTYVDRKKIVAGWCGTGNMVVLTEDFLSGYRVHRASGERTMALLGTDLSDSICARLLGYGQVVAIWLDSDKAGVTAATKIASKCKLYGIPYKNITSEKDPKYYSDAEIRSYLHES